MHRLRFQACRGRPEAFTRRALLAAALAVAALGQWQGPARAAPPTEIRVDWATYNPVSIVLKDKQLHAGTHFETTADN
jgi:hypothetical protein